MTGLVLHSTLGALRDHLARPQVFTVLAGVGVVLGLSGPFGTWGTLGLPMRLIYWGLVVWMTYAAGFIVTRLTLPKVEARPKAVRSAAIGLAVALAVFAVLAAINLGFGMGQESAVNDLRRFGVVLVICLVIEWARQVFDTPGPVPAPALTGAPRLLSRLPLEKRGGLVALSGEDHYVQVVTTKGQHMLLLRLGDAIREAAPLPGLQVHRSHWVALDQIAAVRRSASGASLTLTTGDLVPVSRRFLPALRAAGLFPRRGGASHG